MYPFVYINIVHESGKNGKTSRLIPDVLFFQTEM